MEIEQVRDLLAGIATEHPKTDDSPELRTLRQLAIALLHVAESVHKIEQKSAGPN